MSRRVPLLPWVLSALTFFVSFFLGALAVDPLPVYRAVQEKRLFLSGARREVFAADDGTSLSAFVLGPLSAERPVVLLHGLGADATYWTDAARFLARHGRTVILPDAPGSGRSEPPRDPAGFGLRGRVAAMDALARALALEKFDSSATPSAAGRRAGTRWSFPGRSAASSSWTRRASRFRRTRKPNARVLPRDRAGARRIFDLLFFRKPAPSAGFILDAFGRNYGGADRGRHGRAPRRGRRSPGAPPRPAAAHDAHLGRTRDPLPSRRRPRSRLEDARGAPRRPRRRRT